MVGIQTACHQLFNCVVLLLLFAVFGPVSSLSSFTYIIGNHVITGQGQPCTWPILRLVSYVLSRDGTSVELDEPSAGSDKSRQHQIYPTCSVKQQSPRWNRRPQETHVTTTIARFLQIDGRTPGLLLSGQLSEKYYAILSGGPTAANLA